MNDLERAPLENLTGASLIRKGLDHIRPKKETLESCLFQIDTPKLTLCDWELERGSQHPSEPEIHLDSFVMASNLDACSQYVLLRIFAGFGRAIESRHRLVLQPPIAAT